jgi:hypothetical protein
MMKDDDDSYAQIIQDQWILMGLKIDRYINDLAINHVLSCSPD